jgi:hypothetical protein
LLGAAAVAPAVSRTFAVRAAAAAQLAFLADPGTSVSGQAIVPAVRVAVLDAFGNAVTSPAVTVTVDVATSSGGLQLTGTTSAASVGGVATFSNLRPDRATAFARLRAGATGLAAAIGAAFTVVAP